MFPGWRTTRSASSNAVRSRRRSCGRFWPVCDIEWRGMVSRGAYTGMRFGDVALFVGKTSICQDASYTSRPRRPDGNKSFRLLSLSTVISSILPEATIRVRRSSFVLFRSSAGHSDWHARNQFYGLMTRAGVGSGPSQQGRWQRPQCGSNLERAGLSLSEAYGDDAA